MAFPKADMSLLDALKEVGKSSGGNLTDNKLRYRQFKNLASGEVKMSDLQGSVAALQNYGSGSLSPGMSSRDQYNEPALNPTYTDHTIVPAQSKTKHYFVSRGKAGDAGLITRSFGILPSSGYFVVECKCTRDWANSIHTIEVVGSKTGYLEGGNKYYEVMTFNSTGTKSSSIRIDSQYPYLSVNQTTINKNGSSAVEGGGTWTNLKVTLT